MATLTDRLSRRWEIHHPLLLAVAVAGAVMVLGPKGYNYSEEHKFKLDQLYTCVFTLSTVFTAFLFTFYTFVITAERGFLGRARQSIYFKQTVKYTLGAIIIGGVLCIVTIPMLVVQPKIVAGDPWLIAAALWAALTVWSVSSFVRAAYLFAIFASQAA